jgi:Flp pilus assembly protein TadG
MSSSYLKVLWRKSRLRDYFKQDRGLAAIEFAILGPMFLMMLIVTFETGTILFTEYVLQTSVQEAARIVRTGQAQEKKKTAAQFKTEVCKLAKFMFDCEGKLQVYMRTSTSFGALAASVPSFISIGPDAFGSTASTQYNCGDQLSSVALIATYDWKFLTPRFDWSNNPLLSAAGNINGGKTRRIVAFAIFRNEPFPTVAANVCPKVGI